MTTDDGQNHVADKQELQAAVEEKTARVQDRADADTPVTTAGPARKSTRKAAATKTTAAAKKAAPAKAAAKKSAPAKTTARKTTAKKAGGTTPPVVPPAPVAEPGDETGAPAAPG